MNERLQELIGMLDEDDLKILEDYFSEKAIEKIQAAQDNVGEQLPLPAEEILSQTPVAKVENKSDDGEFDEIINEIIGEEKVETSEKKTENFLKNKEIF